MKKFLLNFYFVLLLSGCGFEPLYVQKTGNGGGWYYSGKFDTSISQEMAQVKVEPIEGRMGQQIRNHLLDSLTPKGAPSSPKYRLYVTLKDKYVMQQALREDITATREAVKYTYDYKMEADGEELFHGDSMAYVSYDILANPYSTTIAQKKSESDAAKILADDMALRVGAYFHSVIKGKQ